MISYLQKKFLGNILKAFFLASASLMIISCSSESYTQQDDETKKKGEQKLFFTENEDGNKTEFEVNFKDGEIVSVYKNGTRIPDEEIKDYKELIDDELGSMKKEPEIFMYNSPHAFHFDMKEFKNNMKEWKENFKNDFDHEKFKEDMDKLKDELADCDDIVIHIDKDMIRKNIEDGMKHLEELKMHNFNFDFDEDELADNLNRITIELGRNRKDHELNMKNLEEKMEQLKDNMDDLSVKMEDLDKEMKILDKFLKAAKNELVKDGLIKSSDEEFELELSESKMEVNNEKVSDELLEKYKSLYKEYFGKELKGKMKFQY